MGRTHLDRSEVGARGEDFPPRLQGHQTNRNALLHCRYRWRTGGHRRTKAVVAPLQVVWSCAYGDGGACGGGGGWGGDEDGLRVAVGGWREEEDGEGVWLSLGHLQSHLLGGDEVVHSPRGRGGLVLVESQWEWQSSCSSMWMNLDGPKGEGDVEVGVSSSLPGGL